MDIIIKFRCEKWMFFSLKMEVISLKTFIFTYLHLYINLAIFGLIMSVFTYIHIHSVLQLISFSFVKILRLRKSCSISIHFWILELYLFQISQNYETRNWPPFAGPYKGVHRALTHTHTHTCNLKTSTSIQRLWVRFPL